MRSFTSCGSARPDVLRADEVGDLDRVHAMAARGEHQQWLPVGGEHEGVRDRRDLAAELSRGRGRGRGRVVQDDRAPGRTRRGESLDDPTYGRVVEGIVHAPEPTWVVLPRPTQGPVLANAGSATEFRGRIDP